MTATLNKYLKNLVICMTRFFLSTLYYLFHVIIHQILAIQVKFSFPLTHLPISNSNIVEIVYNIVD